MRCDQCDGLLMREWIQRTWGRDPHCFGWWSRCGNCGERLDGAILLNRDGQEAEAACRRKAQDRDLKDWDA